MNRAALLGLALACLGAAACHEPVTEVVVVMTSDLSVPGDADTITLITGPGISPPTNFGQGFSNVLIPFPLSMGFVSENGGTGVFSLTVQLTRNFQQIVISRTVTGIRFVPHETRMLVLSLPKVCACSGTTCPNPGINPDCDNLADPITEPFDPARAPPSGNLQPGQQGGPVRVPIDAARVIVDPGMSFDGGSGPLDGPRSDGGLTDGGSTDGSMTDGARTDAGGSDGGAMDGARTEGGTTEGGATDAGATDGAATDAGATDGGGPADAGIG